jgi:ketosteroid isomerase-like protein
MPERTHLTETHEGEKVENVELHRGIFRALNGRDEEALVALCDPSIEVYSVFAAVAGGVYHGHNGVRSWYRDLHESWGEYRVEPESFFDFGERTLAFVVLHGRGGQSGVKVAMPATGVARWRDGLCISHKACDREEALRDLGVSEDALEPIAP